MNTNHGILIAPPKPTDFILGAVDEKVISDRKINDWGIYLPPAENQYSSVVDFLICATMSGVDHGVGSQLNYLLLNNLLPDEALNFFHKHKFIKDGTFQLSSRFNAKLNGTDKIKGNYLNAVADSLRKTGFIAEDLWPTTKDMTWNEFYSTIPTELIETAKQTKWWIDVKYQWVNKEDIKKAHEVAPVQCAIGICSDYESNQVIKKCDASPSHAVLNYKVNPQNNHQIFDHYNPYMKTLSENFLLPYNMQYVVTVKPLMLRKGMYGDNVLKMQRDLKKVGFDLNPDSDFGPRTENAVKGFQKAFKLSVDGIAGPKTLEKLKEVSKPKDLVDVLIMVESNGNDNAIGDKNLTHKAYGCLQIRQGVCDDVNRFHGTKLKSQDCLGSRETSLGIWEKYWEVYPHIVTNEDRARTWNGGPGWKKRYFKVSKTEADIQYCKNLDIYWSKVKKLL